MASKKKAKKSTKPVTDPLPELNDRQLAFVANYVENGGNATKAYRDAGYCAKNADANASRLMGNESIRGLIAARRAQLAQKWSVTEDDIIQILASCAQTTLPDIMNGPEYEYSRWRMKEPSAILEQHKHAIKSYSRSQGEGGSSESVVLYDRFAAIDRLVKLLNLFPNEKGAKVNASSGRNATLETRKDALDRIRERAQKFGIGRRGGDADNSSGGD